MDQIGVSRAEIRRSDKLILALVLALQMKAEEDHCYGHARVACQVHTPSNVVAGCVPVEEDLRALTVLLA